MERLGLWGDGAAFKSFEQFLDTVHKKGLGELGFFISVFNLYPAVFSLVSRVDSMISPLRTLLLFSSNN